MRRVPAAVVLGLLALPWAAGPALADPAPGAPPAGEPVAAVTVVTRAGGGLAFRTERVARSQARARVLRWRGRAGVVAADVAHRVRVTADPLVDQQWGLATLRAPELGAAGDGAGQVIGVVDSGVDAGHPDLAGVVLPGTDLVSGGDGRSDPNGHGTHVAGVAAAVAGNGVGGAGLAAGARILPVRVIGADGSGTDADAARGLVWAVDHGATVVNMSFGGPDRSSVMDAAVRYALDRGVSLVAAAGNEGLAGDPVEWPAANPGVIAVGAVDRAGVRPGWSSTGAHLSLTAPGVGILSTLPGGRYASWSGTSMAAPFVSASVALLHRARPDLTVAGLRDRLTATADDLGPTGFDPQYGWGRVDLYAALGLPPAAPPPSPATPASPPASPSASPSASPAASPSALATPAGTPTPTPVETPTPAPAATAAPGVVPVPTPAAPQVQPARPVVAVRMSASRTRIPYRGAVTMSARTLTTGAVAPGAAVVLETDRGAGWVQLRSGRTGADGLVGWVVRPDRTARYRMRSSGVTSPTAAVLVAPPARRVS